MQLSLNFHRVVVVVAVVVVVVGGVVVDVEVDVVGFLSSFAVALYSGMRRRAFPAAS